MHEAIERIKNVDAAVVSSTSDMVVRSVNSMMREVLLGALFATIVLLLFLRNIRGTLITMFPYLFLFGHVVLTETIRYYFKIVTLEGVAVAVGRLVDDSIVRYWKYLLQIAKGSIIT